jgi:MtfA peptidase
VVDLEAYYREAANRQRRQVTVVAGVLAAVFIAAAAAKESYLAMVLGSLAIVGAALIISHRKTQKHRTHLRLVESAIPAGWESFLTDYCTYFTDLSTDDKELFIRRAMLFFADVRIVGVDTEIDDEIKLRVAAAAVIPTFAFPFFEYPNLREVLIYPEAFNERFETGTGGKDDNHSSGMVGTGFLNYTLLLSRRDLVAGFSGMRTSRNVGIHEFAHLLDKADGTTDGVPTILMSHTEFEPWVNLMDREMLNIERGRSDIDPYALTDHAEFFAVVSEYFFNNPKNFLLYHPELYEELCAMYQQRPAEKYSAVSGTVHE